LQGEVEDIGGLAAEWKELQMDWANVLSDFKPCERVEELQTNMFKARQALQNAAINHLEQVRSRPLADLNLKEQQQGVEQLIQAVRWARELGTDLPEGVLDWDVLEIGLQTQFSDLVKAQEHLDAVENWLDGNLLSALHDAQSQLAQFQEYRETPRFKHLARRVAGMWLHEAEVAMDGEHFSRSQRYIRYASDTCLMAGIDTQFTQSMQTRYNAAFRAQVRRKIFTVLGIVLAGLLIMGLSAGAAYFLIRLLSDQNFIIYI
jgi:hypothetical protein